MEQACTCRFSTIISGSSKQLWDGLIVCVWAKEIARLRPTKKPEMPEEIVIGLHRLTN